MIPRYRIPSVLLVASVLVLGAGLAVWKSRALEQAELALTQQPEPIETVTLAAAVEREFRPSTTVVGTVMALRSITLRNELAGTVRQVALVPGQVVEAGTLLVALDVSVEEAELRAEQAQAELAQSMLARLEQASLERGASPMDVDRARAERDVARARVARSRAVIERKQLRAPFRARVGIANVHLGQYLNEGTELTTLQGVADSAHVDFELAEQVAAGLQVGDAVEVFPSGAAQPLHASVEAIDARVDPTTRSALVRARIDAAGAPVPGASVRVHVPAGAARRAVAVPVSALRRGPDGDHVFVIAPDASGAERAQLRRVEAGPVLGDDVVIQSGLRAGEQVAAAGSFKLRDTARVAIAAPGGQPPVDVGGGR